MAGTLLSARLLQLNAGFPGRTNASPALQPIRSREESEEKGEEKGEETGVACAADVTDPPLKTYTDSTGRDGTRSAFTPLVSARFSFRKRGPSFAWYLKPPQNGSWCCHTPHALTEFDR